MQYYNNWRQNSFMKSIQRTYCSRMPDTDIMQTIERIVLKDEILTRQYFDEIGNVKYHQILLPQHLLQ